MDLVESDFSITQRHPWELSRFSIVSSLIKRFNKTEKKIQILDIGSGDAYVAHKFTEVINAECSCVDIRYTKELIDKISKVYNNSSLNLYSSLDQVNSDEGIDIVTLLDVIEHVPDDVQLIKEVLDYKQIHKDTLIIITVPAYQSLFSNHDHLLKHYRRYNMKMLENTIEKSGLEMVYGGYFFMSLIPPRVLEVIKEKISSKPPEELQHLGNWDKSRWITETICFVLRMDYYLGEGFRKLRINIPGLSSFAICKLK
jgi:tRNA1(Val) A37 N6-methylase TrmN6